MRMMPWKESVRWASDWELAELFDVLATELGLRGYARISLLMTQDARLLRERARRDAPRLASPSVTDDSPRPPRRGSGSLEGD